MVSLTAFRNVALSFPEATEAPHFVELEHHQPSTLAADIQQNIFKITEKALNALGITNGASHTEYKITKDNDIYIIELGGRMGGDFIGSDLVRLSTGYDFVKGVIEIALGSFEMPNLNNKKCSGVYFLCKETEHILPIIEDAQNNALIKQAKITDSELHIIECSADRSGYLIYQSDKKFIPL